MARTMKDRKNTPSTSTSASTKKKVTRVSKAIKKQPQRVKSSPAKKVQSPPKAAAKKCKAAAQVKSKKASPSKGKKQDVLTTLTAQILKKVQKQVKTYETNLLKSAEKEKKAKQFFQEDSEDSYISQEESKDIEKHSAMSEQLTKRKRARKQTKQPSRSASKSPLPLKTNTRSKKTKTYQKLTRSGKQFGEVQIKSNIDVENLIKNEGIDGSAKKKAKSTIKKQTTKKSSAKALLESPGSESDAPSQYQFMEQEDITQTIRYRRPNKNLLIRDESFTKEPIVFDKNISFNNLGDQRNNIFSTSFAQCNAGANTTTTASSRGCSISREDIQSNDESLNPKNSSIFLIRGNNKPKKTVCAKQLPLIFKKPTTLRESIPHVKTKKSDLEVEEQNAEMDCEDLNQSKIKYRQGSTLEDYAVSDEAGKQLVDIVFCCDTTSSMGEYLQATIDYIAAIYKKTQPFEQIIDIKYGFVCYRDHPPEESSYLYRVSNLASPLKTIQFIQQQDAEGGGDTPEAVMDGLYVATSGINWRKQSMKYIIHIADAPPHGDLYTGVSGGFLKRSFVWRDGCPCGLTIEKIAKIMNSLQIHYRLIKAGDNMEKMASIFKSCIQHYADIKVDSPQGLDFILSDMVAKQCLSSEDIQNIPYSRKTSSKNKSRSHSRTTNDDIEQQVVTSSHPFKGINRTYSNNYQAFKSNNDNEQERDGILIEESQDMVERSNYHQQQQQSKQNEKERLPRVNSVKLNQKYTANQLSKLPINYKNFNPQNTERTFYDNFAELDSLE